MSERRRTHPLWELARVRTLEFLREKGAVFWVFVFPVLLALALGIAFRSPTARTLRVALPETMPEHSRLVDLLTDAAVVFTEIGDDDSLRACWLSMSPALRSLHRLDEAVIVNRRLVESLRASSWRP